MQTIKTEMIKVEKTQKGHPALWEKGGGMTKTGHAQLIAGPNGEPKKPVYIRRRGHLACGEHALFIVQPGDIIVTAWHHRRDYEIKVYRIEKIEDVEDWAGRKFFGAVCATLHTFTMGEWDIDPPSQLLPVIDAAVKKAKDYHCRSVYWAVREDEE